LLVTARDLADQLRRDRACIRRVHHADSSNDVAVLHNDAFRSTYEAYPDAGNSDDMTNRPR